MSTKSMTATLTFDQLQTRNASIFETVRELANKFSRQSENVCVLSYCYIRLLCVEDKLAHLVRDLRSPVIERLSAGQRRELLVQAKSLHEQNRDLIESLSSLGLRTNFFYAYAINLFEAIDNDLVCRIRHLEGRLPLTQVNWATDELAALSACLQAPPPVPNAMLVRAMTAYKGVVEKTRA